MCQALRRLSEQASQLSSDGLENEVAGSFMYSKNRPIRSQQAGSSKHNNNNNRPHFCPPLVVRILNACARGTEGQEQPVREVLCTCVLLCTSTSGTSGVFNVPFSMSHIGSRLPPGGCARRTPLSRGGFLSSVCCARAQRRDLPVAAPGGH